jgi:pimeloyl-ACP methyl ester carboxylesterase
MAPSTDLYYVDRGAGRVVLLVHGFPLDHSMWSAQIETLVPHYRVIAPDLRGFGRSPAGGDEVAGMEQFAADLAALLDRLGIGEPVVLAGLSMGGYVAFQFWKQYAARLRGLILCDTRAAADSPEAARLRGQTADRLLREGPAVLIETMLPRLVAPATVRQRPEIVAGLGDVIVRGNAQGLAAALRGMARRPDFTQLLGAIACPTLLVVGSEDVISPPAEMAAIARAMPAARLVEIAGAGHMSPLERPAELNAAVLQFLAGLP